MLFTYRMTSVFSKVHSIMYSGNIWPISRQRRQGIDKIDDTSVGGRGRIKQNVESLESLWKQILFYIIDFTSCKKVINLVGRCKRFL